MTSTANAMSLLERALENEKQALAEEADQLRDLQWNARSEEHMRSRQNSKVSPWRIKCKS